MKELTVAIQDEYEGKVIYRTKLYTEEEYKELENELEYVRTIKDSAEKTLKEVRNENKKLKDEVKDLVERNIELDKKYMLVLTENNKLKVEDKKLKNKYDDLKELCEKIGEYNKNLMHEVNLCYRSLYK